MYLLIWSYILDLVIGDPEWMGHPVRLIGGMINFLESRLRGNGSFGMERIKGVFLVICVISVAGGISYGILRFSKILNPFLADVVWVYLAYTTLATRDLRVKGKAVLKELNAGKIKEARVRLSMIVARDTDTLNKEEITRAVVESVAESVNDAIIAPLFYLILGGPVAAIVYKSVNTLDSMVGYKNEKYLNFGWFSAKLDDCLNYIPARITGLVIACAAGIYNKNFVSSFKIMTRDGKNHLSPNSGISEAAMAGALGIKVGGESSYFGRIVQKPYIGEEKNVLQASCVNEALDISFIASFLMLLGGVLYKWAF
ncbi:MAG: cobalamin biosynthesis protein CobD [Candidatus Omnitrophica bacterium]|nr:cobalamin biosynthesis protein CobD [Candidatus Omnitrophota bacterium]